MAVNCDDVTIPEGNVPALHWRLLLLQLITRALFCILVSLISFACDQEECQQPNPEHEPDNPNSVACLDGQGTTPPQMETIPEANDESADVPTDVDASAEPIPTTTSDAEIALEEDTSGPCEGKSCPENTECKTYTCEDGECVAQLIDGSPCEDGDLCTVDDVCAGGYCTAGTQMDCGDDTSCVAFTCDGKTGECIEVPKDNEPCDDGSLCTENDVCMNGTCSGVVLPCPQSDDPCEAEGICDPETGDCGYERTIGTSCDDGDPCSTADTCTETACVGTPLIDCFYEAAPSVDDCDAGVLGMERKLDARDSLNAIRSLHDLVDVTYDTTYDASVQEAAMMMTVNSQLSHTPPETWFCWSQEGYDMAEASNLSISWQSQAVDPVFPENDMILWLIDDNVPSLGHRRWLLDPFLSTISYGAVGGIPKSGSWNWAQAGVVKVIGGPSADLSAQTLPQVIAYPMGDYPSKWVKKDWYLSASILVDPSSPWNNGNVNFKNADITVNGPSGSLSISDVMADNVGYGIPNNIQWKVSGLKDNTEYTVTFSNVLINSVPETFTYTFTLLP